MTDRYLDHKERVCPECADVIGDDVLVDRIDDCADHMSWPELKEHFRWVKRKHERLVRALEGRVTELELRCRYKEAAIKEATDRLLKLVEEYKSL